MGRPDLVVQSIRIGRFRHSFFEKETQMTNQTKKNKNVQGIPATQTEEAADSSKES